MDSSRTADLERALRLILAHQVDAGLSVYKECLKGDEAFQFPVGTHLFFLRRAGHDKAADALCGLALKKGVDVSLSRSSGSAVEEAVREYEKLIETGGMNSVMIARYVKLLTELGRVKDAAGLQDYAGLLRTVQLDSGQARAAEVHDLILSSEGRAEYQESVQSVRNMNNLRRFHEIRHDAVQGLMRGLRKQIDRYLADWARSTHPLAHLVPTSTRVTAWALISRTGGHNVPHIHHKGWATGVYYPSDLPDGSTGGELAIGETSGEGAAVGSREILIRPQAGLLVLFPSFYTHRTTPLIGAGLRTSVAFDVIRSDGETGEHDHRRRT